MNNLRVKQGRRGQPLFVFAALAVAWIAMRVVLWSPPFTAASGASPANSALTQPVTQAVESSNGEAVTSDREPGLPIKQGWPAAPTDRSPLPGGWSDPARLAPPPSWEENEVSDAFEPVSPRLSAGHALLMAAGFSRLPVPASLEPYLVAREDAGRAGLVDSSGERDAAATRVPFVEGSAAARRWSADGWLLWRKDTTTPITSGRPSYGRSQAGAVARFELAPSSGHRPQAYLRGTTTIEGRRDIEGAIGLSAKPLPQVPVRVAVEARLADRPEGAELRPGAYAVTELPPASLPGGLEGELYLQGGYVGGTYATAFVDGQVRVERSLAEAGDVELRAGASAWGGAQDDAERLDVGPGASLRFRIGETRGRLSADYRFRVAGDAEPSSGPALTLSAGF